MPYSVYPSCEKFILWPDPEGDAGQLFVDNCYASGFLSELTAECVNDRTDDEHDDAHEHNADVCYAQHNDDAAHYQADADADDDVKCVRLLSQWLGSESIRHTQSPLCKQVVVHSFARGVGEFYSLLSSRPLRHLLLLTQSLAQTKSKAHHYGSLAKQFLCVTCITSPFPFTLLSHPLPFHCSCWLY